MANAVKQELLDIETVSFIVLDDNAASEACEIAIKTGVRGMDALVIQVAKEFDAKLVSFDNEMVKKSRKVLA